jgi:hypothetical protein
MHITLEDPWQYFSTIWWHEKVGFWPIDELNHHHDNIHTYVHKKCHLEIYHSDMKYHMTLYIIFSVVYLSKDFEIFKILGCWDVDGLYYPAVKMVSLLSASLSMGFHEWGCACCCINIVPSFMWYYGDRSLIYFFLNF